MIKRLKTGAILVGFFGLALFAEPPSSNLNQELAAQHFSGELKGDVHLTTLGTLPCGNRYLRVIYYEWYQTNPPGFAVHASYRVILMHGAKYVGSYTVEAKPRIQGDVLRFPHSAYGDTITCGKKGVLPKNAWLDGELNPLFK
jgi:hypothetical protein